MPESEIITFRYPNGEYQRVQKVTFDSWSQLEYLLPSRSERAFDSLCSLYKRYIIPKCPWLFGRLILFRIPDDVTVPFPFETERYGSVADKLTAAAIALRSGVVVAGNKPVFLSGAVREFWRCLEVRNCVKILCGYLPHTTVLPVNDLCGFLTDNENSAAFRSSASFFTMERFDCASAYDSIGTPIGLHVKDGFIFSPPMYLREALLVGKDGKASIAVPRLSDLTMEINGSSVTPDETNTFFRPSCRITPKHGERDLVIIGSKIAAVHEGGNTFVPSSGFVLRDCGTHAMPGDTVTYHGLEDVLFGIQAGNSAVVNGKKTGHFISPFYNIKRLWSTSYPPSLYPLNYNRDRAPRMVLGTDSGGTPVILWAEGAGKLKYSPGKESCGASLSEMEEICQKRGLVNAVHLDGGGSAQILMNDTRSLLISDRNLDNTEAERAIPVGLMIR